MSDTTKHFTLTFWLLSQIFVRRNLFSSLPGSRHSRVITWQEIGYIVAQCVYNFRAYNGKPDATNDVQFAVKYC